MLDAVVLDLKTEAIEVVHDVVRWAGGLGGAPWHGWVRVDYQSNERA